MAKGHFIIYIVQIDKSLSLLQNTTASVLFIDLILLLNTIIMMTDYYVSNI